jgi:hypothetical protein
VHSPHAGMAPAEAPQQQQQQPVPQSLAPAVQPAAGQQPVMAATSQPQMTAAQFLAGLPQQHQVQVT